MDWQEKAFNQRVENARVALMSNNMFVVAYLKNQVGAGHFLKMN